MRKGRSLKGPKAPRGQAPKLVTGRHHLFHGELSDAPGRNESWDHFLCYRENSDTQALGSAFGINCRPHYFSLRPLKWRQNLITSPAVRSKR
jgi:hypothetical protein